MPATRVLILFNEPILPEGHSEFEAEHEILEIVQFVSRALDQAGYAVSQLALGDDPATLVDSLREEPTDVVFNLFEGTATRQSTEVHVPGLLEWLGIPFTGCPSEALGLARNKHVMKRLFQGAGIPTPAFVALEGTGNRQSAIGNRQFPLIVKPGRHHASEGLDQGSVVTDAAHLHKRVAYLQENYGASVLVEEFIAGREFNVALAETPELRALPISEILFLDKTPGYWPILTYDAKWKEGEHECEATPPRCPADVEPALANRLAALALQAFQLVGCRDYARADFRVNAAGQPYLLEINPNPSFHPNVGFARALAAAGLEHARFAVQLVHNALGRKQSDR